jgi:uncharacterized protein YjiS (DUF1127 family)
MASITTNATVTGHGVRVAASSVFHHPTDSLRAAWVRGNERRAYRRMLECDEHILHDIGLTRDDVRKAMAELNHH